MITVDTIRHCRFTSLLSSLDKLIEEKIVLVMDVPMDEIASGKTLVVSVSKAARYARYRAGVLGIRDLARHILRNPAS